jgi:tRNA(Met) C34 N-acetyltransferase TmcA
MKEDFKKWIEDYGKVFRASIINDIEDLFGEFDPEVYQETLAKRNWDKKSLQLFTAYRTEITTRRLVLATWVLAIGTLILSGLTILLTFLK